MACPSSALLLVVMLLRPGLAGAAKPGDLDGSFGGGGKVMTNFGSDGDANSVAIDSRGRIVAAGGAGNPAPQFALARYRPNGRLDPSFSGDGLVTSDFGGTFPANSVAIDSHGKVVAAGGSFAGSELARYKHDGSLDSSFGAGGLAATPGFVARSVAIDRRDRVVVAGIYQFRFAVARYRWNGTLDPSFGSDGIVTTSLGPRYRTDESASVAIDSRGRIVAAGYTHASNSARRFALARYKSNGTLDPSFSHGGTLRVAVGGPSYANSVAIDSEGRIVAAGVGARKRHFEFALARYTTNGSPDRSFSRNGEALTRFRSPDAGAKAVAVDSRDRIVAAGTAGVSLLHDFSGDYAIARYKTNGHLDRSLSGNGRIRTQSRSPGALAAAIDSRDRIIVAGGPSEFFLFRYIG
jgi:uncharacterized delta-60 repeat protein